VVCVLALALLVGVTQMALALEAKGHVQSVNADKEQFVLKDSNQKNWTIHMAKDGKVFINDKEGKLSDLQKDDEVKITYEKDGDRLTASEVRCTRK
jgi:hypothetical protein